MSHSIKNDLLPEIRRIPSKEEFESAIERLVKKVPHDKNGNLIEVGDRIDIPCIVTNIQATDDYCNCTVETTEKMAPEFKYTNTYTLNTKMVEKVEN
jgi:hypothetical protein